VSLEKSDDYCVEIYPYNSKRDESCWRWGIKLSLSNINEQTQKSNGVAKVKRDGGFNIYMYEKYRK